MPSLSDTFNHLYFLDEVGPLLDAQKVKILSVEFNHGTKGGGVWVITFQHPNKDPDTLTMTFHIDTDPFSKEAMRLLYSAIMEMS